MKTNKKNIYCKIPCLLLVIIILFTAITGCRKNTTNPAGNHYTRTQVQITDEENLAESQTDIPGSVARSTLVVDFIFYSENPDEKYDIPDTFERNGKTYHFTGESLYTISEPMEGIAQYVELAVEEQEDIDSTFLFTSPETGATYSLHRSTTQFSEEKPIEITLKALTNFGPARERPNIPEAKEIEYYNKITKQDEIAIAPLAMVNNTDYYWLEADDPIRGTFYTDFYGLNYWVIGWEVDEENSTSEHTEYVPCKVPVDIKYSTYPSWEGFQDDVIKWLNLDPAFFRVTAAGWNSEIYEKTEYNEIWNKDIVVAYRDAVYPYEVLVKNYSASYETNVQTMGYEAKIWYFASEEDLRKESALKKKKNTDEKINKDVRTLYQITASATYCYEEPLNDNNRQSKPQSTGPLPSGTPVPEYALRLEELRNRNSDVYGIIRIQDTVLNHPLMRCAEDESFYLRRNLEGEDDICGVPFLTLDSNLNAPRSNSIVYGHNIHKNKRDVFCDLAEYESTDYYLEHPIISVTTEDGTDDYIIFAYYLIDTADTEDNFPYWETTRFSSINQFLSYMEEVKKRNWLELPLLDLTREDSYISLSSCSLELSGSKTNRMVVMARKIRENEKIENKIKGAAKAESPLLPCRLREITSDK